MEYIWYVCSYMNSYKRYICEICIVAHKKVIVEGKFLNQAL